MPFHVFQDTQIAPQPLGWNQPSHVCEQIIGLESQERMSVVLKLRSGFFLFGDGRVAGAYAVVGEIDVDVLEILVKEAEFLHDVITDREDVVAAIVMLPRGDVCKSSAANQRCPRHSAHWRGLFRGHCKT